MQRLLSLLVYLLSGLGGLVAYGQPFILAALQRQGAAGEAGALSQPASMLLALALISVSLLALLAEGQGQALNAKIVAALGTLVAFAAALRFLENAIPGPAGFTPIFAPIILAGYVFGPRFGLLMGSLSLLTSALVTGGVGPWLPYQIFAAGWMGLSAGLLPRGLGPRPTLALLAAFGFMWGFLYGAILNLYFWPFLAGDPAVSWQPGEGVGAALGRYLAFYVATSAVWDLAAALGNVALVLVAGLPVVRALSRFRDQFRFRVVAA
ncbi:MAG: ECF transporter S component [Candidatus Promineifilaceae bacterium]